MSAEELAVIRHLAAEWIGNLDVEWAFGDMRMRIFLALSEVDLLVREEGGSGPITVTQYKRLRPEWAPHPQQIYAAGYKSWKHALADNGLLGGSQPQYHLALVDGRPKGGGASWTIDNCVHSLAKCIDAMLGRTPSRSAYDDFRRQHGARLPDSNTIVGKKNKSGSERSWNSMCDLAVQHILATDPAVYPRAHAFLSRVAASEAAA
jgi:hypothetical protein